MCYVLGGDLEFAEANWIIHSVVTKMPMPCRFVSPEMLDVEKEIEAYIAHHNLNPISFGLALRLNLANIRRYSTQYDYFWLGKYQ